MTNKELIDNRWKLTRKKLKEFNYLYERLNLKTQDEIQEVIKSYNITPNTLYKTISSTDKKRINRKIENWKDKGIFKGYFKYRVEELTKGNITYKDLAEILIYGAYAEEQKYLDFETNSLCHDVALDCYNQGREELNKKRKSILPYFILSSFGLALVDGCNWKNYFDALVLTNMQETLKQYMVFISQNKDIDVYSELMQRTFEKQRNRLICINDDKFSGGLDKYVTALGNLAFIEASGIDNQQVKFISDHCEHVTEMCEYMDGMIFNTRTRNKFKRPMGANKSDLTIQDVDIMGLVVGINQPPITNHFHWCHSTLTYMIAKTADELRNIIYKINKTLGLGTKDNYTLENHKPPALLGTISKEVINSEEKINSLLKGFENEIKDSKIENAIVITQDGEVYQCFGNETNVWVDIDLKDKLKNSIVTHNHLPKYTSNSFSRADANLFEKYNLKILRGVDNDYTYELNKNKKAILSMPDDFWNDDYGIEHLKNIQFALENNVCYMRWKNGKSK